MPKLACPCGYIHDLTPIPDDGWVAVRDQDYEPLLDAEMRQREIEASTGGNSPPETHPLFGEWQKSVRFSIISHNRIYDCPKCGRLIWRRKHDGQVTYTVYTKES